MYVDIIIPLTKVIPIKFEPVTIYYQTLQTLIGHNGTRNHSLRVTTSATVHFLSV